MRTEADKLAMTPMIVKLGKKDYGVKPLANVPQREWRKSVVEKCQPILDTLGVGQGHTSASVWGGLASLLTSFPDVVADLLLSYDTDLPREEILQTASDEQINLAFQGVMRELAYPSLFGTLDMLKQILGSERLLSQKAASTSLQ